MSFQKLFKKADEVSGFLAPFALDQADTSAFDVDEEEEEGSRSSRITIAGSEVDKLHAAIRRVVIRPPPDSVVVGRMRNVLVKEERGPSPTLQEFLIGAPDTFWEAEVERTMQVDSDKEEIYSSGEDDHRKGRLGHRRGSMDVGRNVAALPNTGNESVNLVRAASGKSKNVQGFVCFDEDDVHGTYADPLDVLIPNPDREDYMKLVPENETAGMSEGTDRDHRKIPVRSRSMAVVTASEPDSSAPEPMDMSLLSKAERDKQRKLEKVQRIKGVDVNFDAAASIERSANMRPRDLLPMYRNRANRSLIAALNHCTVAAGHKNTKPDLYEVELKYFHRPRMIRERDRAWQILPKSVYRKASKHGSSGATTTPSGSAAKLPSTADVDKQNLSLTSTHAEYILLEYVEEFPPVMLNYGMASAMFNYYRAPEGVEEEDAHKAQARSENNKVVESVLSDRNRSRLPRHLMLLLQLRNVKQSYDHDVSVPRLRQGETKVLNSEDESPFLGNIEEGEIQQSLTNNLFRAPIFKHNAHPTDFLLIRTKATATQLTFVLREIPHLYLCGQQEPQRMVPRPVPMITQLQEKFYLLAAVRFLQTHFEGADFDDLERNLLKYCIKESSAPHKVQHRTKLKAILRKVAEESRDTTGMKWYPREFADAEQERQFSQEEIARSFTPEDVCLQESCNAAEYRLFQQHIGDVDLSKLEAWLTHTHRVKQLQMDRAEKTKRLANDCKAQNPALSQAIERFLSVLIKQIQRTDAKLAVGRFIFDRLVSAPWNTTEAFVRSHLERDGQGKLELQGVGDPSGRGEGFSFVRIVKNTRAGPATKKNTVKYFATDSDLRKLTKKDAVRLLVALGVREAEAVALKRWDRVHMIREFSTKLEKTGLAKELHKYARSGADATAVNTGESFQRIAQEIWNRQKAALSNPRPPAAIVPAVNSAVARGEGSAAQESKGQGHGQGEDEESDSDNESEEDFAESIARSLAARAAASATLEKQSRTREQIEEEERKELDTLRSSLGGRGTSSSSATAAVSKVGDGSAALKKRKVHVGGMDEMAPGHNAGEALEGAFAATLGVPVVSSASEEPSFVDQWVRPRRVVKRTVRSVLSDGTECIRVEFVLDQAHVDRVDRMTGKWRKERELRRSATAAGGYASAHAVEEDEDAEAAVATTAATMTLKLGKMKKAVDHGNLVLRRSEFEVDEVYYGGGEAKPLQKSSKRSTEIVINSRVPRVSLAARLEEELMKLWPTKFAYAFRFPVNAVEAPGYYQRVPEPICLNDIREKIVSFQYETAAAMQADVNKMAANCELYNGPASPYTQSVKKLVNMLQINLQHDRTHLGAEHDTIAFMEEAIRRKKAYLRKSDVEPSALNPLIPPPR